MLTRLAGEAEADPRLLEQAEERLFALRAVARKHAVAVAELPALLDTLCARLAALDTGCRGGRSRWSRRCGEAREAYRAGGCRAGGGAAGRRGQAGSGGGEGAAAAAAGQGALPCRRGRAGGSAIGGRRGRTLVRFLIATNPGQELGPLGRIASGGELSRLMLALKVVLSSGSPVPTLVFDEVDADVGGATAAAVGERLARVAERVQVLVVTHSPQVAARGGAHLLVSKQAARGRAATLVDQLDARARREEIARMLAGETVTEAARAAADDLLGAACMTHAPRQAETAVRTVGDLTEQDAAAELAAAGEGDRPPRSPVPSAGRTGDQRRRVRCAAPAQRRDRGALPASDPRGLALQPRRRRAGRAASPRCVTACRCCRSTTR